MYLGEPAIYAMVVWLQENMPAILAERGIVDDVSEFVEEIDNSEKDDFVLTGRGAHIKRTYARLEGEEAKMHAEEEERRKRIEYFRAMMAEENAREAHEVEEEHVRAMTPSQSIALTTEEDVDDTSLDAKLSRWEREHAKRLEAARTTKVKKKIVPNLSKSKPKLDEVSDGDAKPKMKGGWLANQVKKAGLDKQADVELEEDALATATANVLAGVSGVRPEKYTVERRAEISRKLLELELAKESTKEWLGMQEIRRKLPAHNLKSVVLEAIESSNAAVVSGATGCGKTTQVPQFIFCLLYTSPSPRDRTRSRMPSSA